MIFSLRLISKSLSDTIPLRNPMKESDLLSPLPFCHLYCRICHYKGPSIAGQSDIKRETIASCLC
jgi:hypothetical protein